MIIAEKTLQNLGITTPKEIDVEAIAMSLGAYIKYEAQPSCEASITGYKDKAVIKVSPDVDRRRMRFSAAHECGHWELHKGQEFRCRSEDIEYGNFDSITDPEKQANEYAASLLLPEFLFEPMLSQAPRISFDLIKELSDTFDTSLLSTTIRIIDLTSESAIVLYITPSGWKWFRGSKSVPRWCWPLRKIEPESFAADLLNGKTFEGGAKGLMSGDTWFDFKNSDSIEIYEESIVYGDAVLTLLTRLPEA